MKIALLIAGVIDQELIDSNKIYKYIIDDNNVDIYIYINILDNKKYINKHLDIKEIQTILKPKFIII